MSDNTGPYRPQFVLSTQPDVPIVTPRRDAYLEQENRKLKEELEAARKEIERLRHKLHDQEVKHKAEVEKVRRQFLDIVSGGKSGEKNADGLPKPMSQRPRGVSFAPSVNSKSYKESSSRQTLQHSKSLGSDMARDLKAMLQSKSLTGTPRTPLMPSPHLGPVSGRESPAIPPLGLSRLADLSNDGSTVSKPTARRPLRPQVDDDDVAEMLLRGSAPGAAVRSPSPEPSFSGRNLRSHSGALSHRSMDFEEDEPPGEAEDEFEAPSDDEDGRNTRRRGGLMIFNDAFKGAPVRVTLEGEGPGPVKAKVDPSKHKYGIDMMGAAVPDHITSLEASPHTSGVVAVANYPENSASIWDWTVYPGHMVTTLPLPVHTKRVSCVAFSPSHTHIIAMGSDDETISVSDFTTGKHQCTLEGLCGKVKAIAFSAADPSLLIAAYEDGIVKVWDWTRGMERTSILACKGDLRTLSLCPSERELACVGGALKTLKVINYMTGETVRDLEYPAEIQTSVFQVAFHTSPEETDLLAVAGDTSCYVYNWRTGRVTQELKGHVSFVVSVAWSPHMKHVLASGSMDKCARVWDIRTGTCMYTINVFSTVRTVYFSPVQPRLLLVGGESSSVGLSRLREKQADAEAEEDDEDGGGMLLGALFASPSKPKTRPSTRRNSSNVGDSSADVSGSGKRNEKAAVRVFNLTPVA